MASIPKQIILMILITILISVKADDEGLKYTILLAEQPSILQRIYGAATSLFSGDKSA